MFEKRIRLFLDWKFISVMRFRINYKWVDWVVMYNINNQLILNNKKLLLKMKFPFDFTIFPLYEFVIVAQFVFECFVALTAGMLMAFSAALVSWLFLLLL